MTIPTAIPTDVLSGLPKAPLYIGFPSQVWALEGAVMPTRHNNEVATHLRLFVDEESARHGIREYILAAYRSAGMPEADALAAAHIAQRDWVEGEGTVWTLQHDNDYDRQQDPFAHIAKIVVTRRDVWMVRDTPEGYVAKTVALSRRDALGALGR